MSDRVLMIDDDAALAGMVAEYLGSRGLSVTIAGTLEQGETLLKRGGFDVLILDAMLPDGDGFDLCKAWRQQSALPILMLTARGEEADKVIGLELGADDYMTKPFSTRELTARIRALLRRAGPSGPAAGQPLRVGLDLAVFPDAFQVTVEGQPVSLTASEFRLLCALAEAPGRVLSRDQLLNRLWSDDRMVLDRTIDVHVKHLRDKLGKAGRHIKAVRSVGYKIEP